MTLVPQSPSIIAVNFTFVDQIGIGTNESITSAPVYPSDHYLQVSIEVSGTGTYSINGGAETTSPGLLNPGDYFQAHHTSSGNYAQNVDTVVTLAGTVSDTFRSRTINNPVAFTPVRNLHFENGTPGELADGSDGYDSIAQETPGGPQARNEYSTARTRPGGGSQVCRHFHPESPVQGDEDGGNRQGLISLSSDITDEIWIRCHVLLEAGYFLQTQGASQKFLRANMRINGTKTGNNWGCGIKQRFGTSGEGGFTLNGNIPSDGIQTWYYNNPCAYTGQDFPFERECWYWGPDGWGSDQNVIREQWYNVEYHVKLSADSTGFGRLYVDKKLMWESGPMQTKPNAGDGIYEIKIFSGAQPGWWTHDQYAYVDDIVVTDGSNPPPNLSEDAFQYPIIGDWTG
jgi:hypothetical protein